MQERDFKRWRTRSCDEYFNNPSRFAMRVWFYLRCIGQSRHDSSFRQIPSQKDGFILHFLKRGALWHRFGKTTHIAKRGEACLIELAHDVEYGTQGNQQAEFDWLWFNGKDMPLIFYELGADQEPVFRPLDVTKMQALIRELRRLTAQPPPAYEARASSLLTAILAELQGSRFPASHGAMVDGVPRPLSDPIRRGIWYIARYYDRPLSVKDIVGRAAHTSPAHFSRLFRREVGMSPGAYLNQFRVEQAKRLLETTARTIDDVAGCVGYADPGYFARVFTQATGLSPRRYRGRIRKTATVSESPKNGGRCG